MRNYAKGLKPKITVDGPMKEIEEKRYVKIGDRYVGLDQYDKFIRIVYDRMDDVMKWVAFKKGLQRYNLGIPIMNKLGLLFIEIEKRSQVKF